MDERRALEQQLEQWKQMYDKVASVTLDGNIFIYRSITRYEFRRVMNTEYSDAEKEDLICQIAILFPEDFNVNHCKAGYITTLARLIMEASYLNTPDAPGDLLASFRLEMLDVDNQIDCIIKEAFPEFDIEELPHWTIRQAYFYLSRAEWILANLRGVHAILQTLPQNNVTQQPPASPHSIPEHIQNFQSEEQTINEDTPRLRKEYPPEYYNLPPEFRDRDSSLDVDYPDYIFED